jgi:hypothetical protein
MTPAITQTPVSWVTAIHARSCQGNEDPDSVVVPMQYGGIEQIQLTRKVSGLACETWIHVLS